MIVDIGTENVQFILLQVFLQINDGLDFSADQSNAMCVPLFSTWRLLFYFWEPSSEIVQQNPQQNTPFLGRMWDLEKLILNFESNTVHCFCHQNKNVLIRKLARQI